MDPNIIGRIYVRGEREPEHPRSTLHLTELYISESLLGELHSRHDIEIGGGTSPLVDSAGNCQEVW